MPLSPLGGGQPGLVSLWPRCCGSAGFGDGPGRDSGGLCPAASGMTAGRSANQPEARPPEWRDPSILTSAPGGLGWPGRCLPPSGTTTHASPAPGPVHAACARSPATSPLQRGARFPGGNPISPTGSRASRTARARPGQGVRVLTVLCGALLLPATTRGWRPGSPGCHHVGGSRTAAARVPPREPLWSQAGGRGPEGAPTASSLLWSGGRGQGQDHGQQRAGRTRPGGPSRPRAPGLRVRVPWGQALGPAALLGAGRRQTRRWLWTRRWRPCPRPRPLCSWSAHHCRLWSPAQAARRDTAVSALSGDPGRPARPSGWTRGRGQEPGPLRAGSARP